MKEAVKSMKRACFCEPETRSGYYVTKEKKDVWKVQLDMLEVFQRICKTHGLQYWAIAGTLLGAVRHRGFIPWDDDMDLAMPRKDYDRMIEVLPAELPPELFLQTWATDHGSITPHARICNCRTTCIDEAFVRLCKPKFNMGLFIDFFPLDEKPMWETLRKSKLRRALFLRRLIRKAAIGRHFSPWFMYYLCHTIVELLGYSRIFQWHENLFRNVVNQSEANVKFSMNASEWGWDSRYSWPKELFSETTTLPFEYLEIPVPRCYEKVLELTYGDWRKFVIGDAMHDGFVQDACVDYETMLVERFGYKKSDFQP